VHTDSMTGPSVLCHDGSDALKSALLGSVSRDVVNAYHRPVIIV
jgi:nucleotide-binding universal stress UspA family protein